MNHYHYKCFDCNKTFSSNEIEKKFIYLCPNCGKLEKKKPLKGILLIEYDYESISRKYSKEKFLKQTPGKIWNYPFLWPVNKFPNEKILSLIQLNNNPVYKLYFNKKEFLVLDDTRNPTLSFKDRASILVTLKAVELGVSKISAASTGNAGSSLAGICSRLGLESVIIVPKKIPEAKRIQIQSFGAEIILVDGDYDLAFDTCLEISWQKKWYNRNTAYNPLTIEGKKSAAFDIFIATKGKIPKNIFIPTGDGVILSGLYKGFVELKKLNWIEKIPKLFSVQSKGSDAFYRFLKTNKFNYKETASIADSICAGAPRALYLGVNAIIKTKGDVILVDDNEILESQKYVAKNYGVLIEPSSAAAFAAFIKNMSNDSLLLFTGNGLKDLSTLTKWNIKPNVLSLNKIKEKFIE